MRGLWEGVALGEMDTSLPLPTTQPPAAHHQLLLGLPGGITIAAGTGKQIFTPCTGLDQPKQRESPRLMQAQPGEGSFLCPKKQSPPAARGQARSVVFESSSRGRG